MPIQGATLNRLIVLVVRSPLDWGFCWMGRLYRFFWKLLIFCGFGELQGLLDGEEDAKNVIAQNVAG